MSKTKGIALQPGFFDEPVLALPFDISEAADLSFVEPVSPPVRIGPFAESDLLGFPTQGPNVSIDDPSNRHEAAISHTTAEPIQVQEGDLKVSASPDRYTTDTQGELPGKAEDNISPFSRGEIVTYVGHDYRFHRARGEMVYLVALDAGRGGPFYWVRADEVRSKASRSDRVRAAQKRLASCKLNGPEYMDALGEMAREMREGRDG